MISDLPINTNGKLSVDARKQLALIIEKEFTNKESLYHQVMEQEKEKIVALYRKQVGFEALKKAYEKAKQAELLADVTTKKAGQAITDVGLTLDGTPDTSSHYDHYTQTNKQNYNGKELAKKLEVIERNAPSQNLKAKLISRLMLSTTIGEANEIMKEVLGNNILPTTDIKAITFGG